jgi:hypothetical protein
MGLEIQIDPLGDHEYLVRFAKDGQEAMSRFQASESVVDQLGVPSTEELRLVAETAGYLAERQPVIDIPPMIDLDDVAAAYGDDYLGELSRRLQPL